MARRADSSRKVQKSQQPKTKIQKRKLSKPKKELAKKQMQTIREYVAFDYKRITTVKQAKKIDSYFKEIQALKARPHHIYKTKSKKKLKAVQVFSQHENMSEFSEISVAFLPSDGLNKPKVIYKKGKVVTETKHVLSNFIELDHTQIAQKEGSALAEYLKSEILADNDYKRFSIHAGKYEIKQTFSRKSIVRETIFYTTEYNDKRANNYFGNWLHGVTGYEFKRQASFTEFRNAKRESRNEILAENKRARYRKANQKRKAKR